jgi:hypothetical protein
MARYKGQRTFAMNERDFPHLVAIPIPPGGLGMTLNQMHDWHRQNGVQHHGGSGGRREQTDYATFCLADPATADAFHERFGGERMTAAK